MGEPKAYSFQDDFRESRKELNWSRIKGTVRTQLNPDSDLDLDLDLYLDLDSEDIGFSYDRWVFWSREDGVFGALPTLLYDKLGFIPLAPNGFKLKDKIRQALQNIMEALPFCVRALIQFWEATTSLEGRTFLTTQNQPFALTCLHEGLWKYRKISEDYKLYVDGKNDEDEDLGIPGRVYLHKSQESTPNVKYYTDKEYPRRDHALSCGVSRCWALPVFEYPSQICFGVLELVGEFQHRDYPPSLYKIFEILQLHLPIPLQEQGLRCLDVFKCCDMQNKDMFKAQNDATMDIKRVFRLVSRKYELPVALLWVLCTCCNSLWRDESCCKTSGVFNFIDASSVHHCKKGKGVAGRALSSCHLYYCSDVMQFNLTEYPLALYARECRLRECIAISLQRSYDTGNEVYVLEFFLPVGKKHGKNSSTLVSGILGTVKEHFINFKLASGEELGEELSVEVIDFQKGQKLHSVQASQTTRSLPSLEPLQNGGEMMQLDTSAQQLTDVLNNGINGISAEGCDVGTCSQAQEKGTTKTKKRKCKSTGVRIEISLEDILETSKMSRDDAARNCKVSLSTFKRACRQYGISRWPPRNMGKIRPPLPSRVDNLEEIPQPNSNLPLNKVLATDARALPHDTAMANANMVTIRAKYLTDITIKFHLPLASGLVELQQQVAKRLNLEAGSYYIKYKDEEDEFILIACNEDLQDCIHTSRSLGSTSVGVLLQPK